MENDFTFVDYDTEEDFWDYLENDDPEEFSLISHICSSLRFAGENARETAKRNNMDLITTKNIPYGNATCTALFSVKPNGEEIFLKTIPSVNNTHYKNNQ